ncbi:MAG: hypothetical protein P4L79_06250 [Legionella sp.]|uniref:hypothetical protein n=1 Tax=Legionella sp. TaxID=459 RepID=UPI0028428D3F|nr:hypothetical protein [Legionella sp.]
MPDISKILEGIQKLWPTWYGLILSEALVIGLLVPFHTIGIPLIFNIVVCSVLFVAVSLIWYFSNKLPKTKKDKIGFVVSISCDDDNHKIIRDDFILTLRRLLITGNIGNLFHFIEVPKHIACTIIDQDNARDLRIKTKAHFILYGRSRSRTINSKEHTYIELDGLVVHGQTSDTVKDQLSKEFGELLPRKIAIENVNGFIAFEATSGWVELVAKYIIGIAAEVSGNLDYAEVLFSDVQSKLQNHQNIPVYIKLKERLPIRFTEIYEARCILYYNKWRESHEDDILDKLDIELSKIELRRVTYATLNLKAIYQFIKHRNVTESIRLLKSCANSYKDAVWHMNIAFLEAYRGNIKKALQHYRNALKLNVVPESAFEIENFITYILSIEPHNVHLLFCLGYINWKIKEDNMLAISNYNEFISKANPDTYSEQIEYAHKWVAEIERSMT